MMNVGNPSRAFDFAIFQMPVLDWQDLNLLLTIPLEFIQKLSSNLTNYQKN